MINKLDGVPQNTSYPIDSSAAAVFGNREQSAIALSGPFTATDRSGAVWGVKAILINTEGYIADVSVVLDRHGAFDADLCDDDTFIAAVFEQLRKVGYEGSAFGRTELGMQGDSVVMLEPNDEFTAFAISKGFTLLKV